MKAIFANSLDVMLDAAPWDESKVNREPEGEGGGQFAAGTGTGATRTETPPPNRNVGAPQPSATPEGGEQAKASKSGHLVAAPADREQWPEHIKKLVIPPAWVDLKISADPEADLQAIGKDAKGRKQYLYSDKFSQSQAALKFARMESLRKDKPQIESQLAALQKSADRGQRDHADGATLVMKMGVRPGSETDTKAKKKAYGATTIEGRHVVNDGGQVYLRFDGKDGVFNDLPVVDKTLAGNLVKRAKQAGETGRLFGNVRDGSLLDFVHGELDHGGYKTKDFRTLLANEFASKSIKGIARPTDDKSYKKAVREVAVYVSGRLGNTPTVALQSYIHPALFAEWKSGFVAAPPAVKGAKAKSAAPAAKLASDPGMNAAQRAWATRRAAKEAQGATA
jgi:DNA topoisomerase I